MSSDAVNTVPRANRRRVRAILGLAGSTHALHDGYAAVLYVLFPLWAQELGLSLSQVGLLKGIFSGFIAVFQFPAGLLAERLGGRGLLAAGTAGLGLGFAAFGVAGGFATLAMALALAGLCSAVQHPLASAIVSDAFREGSRRAALGTYNFAGDIGKAVFPAVIAALTAVAGWRAGSIALGGLGIVVATGLYFALVRLGAGGDASEPSPPAQPTAPRPRAGFGIRDRRGFAVLGVIGIVDSGGRGAFLTFVPFLLAAKGADVALLGLAITLIAVGGATGKLACGLLAERWGIIRTVVATETASALGIVALIFASLPVTMLLLPFVGAALNGTSSVLYGTIGDLVDRECEVRAFGLFYGLVFAANAIAPFASGMASDAFGLAITMAAIAVLFLLTLPLCVPLSAVLRPALPRAI